MRTGQFARGVLRLRRDPRRPELAMQLCLTFARVPDGDHQEVVKVLNQHLGDAFDLASQVKQAHWNVKGSAFSPPHRYERAVALGYRWSCAKTGRAPVAC